MQKKKILPWRVIQMLCKAHPKKKKNRKKDNLCVKHTLYPEGGVGAQISWISLVFFGFWKETKKPNSKKTNKQELDYQIVFTIIKSHPHPLTVGFKCIMGVYVS